MIGSLAAIMVFAPVFIIPGLFMGAFGGYLGKCHIAIAFDVS
jgi:hypothetical protein